MANQYPKLVHKQFNSPMGLYSNENIREVLDREAQMLGVGGNYRNPHADAMTSPTNIHNSAVLRLIQEEAAKSKNGDAPTLKRVAWPPPEEGGRGHLEPIPIQEVVSSLSAQSNPNQSRGFNQQSPQLSNHRYSPSTSKPNPQLTNSQQSAGQNSAAFSPVSNPPSNPVTRPWAPHIQPTQSKQQESPKYLYLNQESSPQPAPQQYQPPKQYAPASYQSNPEPHYQPTQSYQPQSQQEPPKYLYLNPVTPKQSEMQYQAPQQSFQQYHSLSQQSSYNQPLQQTQSSGPAQLTHPHQQPPPPSNYPQQQQQQQQSLSNNQPYLTNQQQKYFEPPPTTIKLKTETPVSQVPAPVYSAQPATATLRGGKHLRGDLKWPPPECKQRMEEDRLHEIDIQRGPQFRPRKNCKDYTEFFNQHALNSTYPGYKIPPGTQYYYQQRTMKI